VNVRRAFGKAIYDLQLGHLLSMPLSRAMPAVGSGVAESQGDVVMKKRTKGVVARTAGELAEILGLERADGIEIAVRSALNTKIIEVIAKRKLTHVQVAHLAGTSRTRVTAIVNRNTKDISTYLMLRVLGALGVSAKVTFGRAA